MDLSKGARKRKGGTTPKRRHTKKTISRKKVELPKTVKAFSRRSKSVIKTHNSRANSGMSITELQFMAKSRGLPFGGLTKTKLIRKLNNYF